MGLDTSHECWHGAYSAFSRWRNQLCLAAGWHLEEQDDDGGMTYSVPREIDWAAITEVNLAGEWAQEPEDPLVILIAHYDCDGHICWQHTEPLATRLEGLLPQMEAAGDGGGHLGLYATATRQFIDGLRLAHARGEDVMFG